VQSRLELDSSCRMSPKTSIGFEEAFYALFAKIRELIFPSPTLQTSIFSPSSSSVRDSNRDTHVRLPKLNLSTFSGKYDERFPFFDSFDYPFQHLVLKYAKISVFTGVSHRRCKRCNQFIRIVGRLL